MIKAIGDNVAQYVTIETFAEALRRFVIDELKPELLHAGRQTPPDGRLEGPHVAPPHSASQPAVPAPSASAAADISMDL